MAHRNPFLMPWQTITVRIPDEFLKEAIIGEFSADRIAGVWERSDGSNPNEVVFYFEEGRLPPLARARIQRTFERNGFGLPEILIGVEGDADWTLEWRRGFSSFPVGDRFRVVPSWEDPPSGDTRIPLRLDPGMAFGTGTHETTRMVLETLETAGAAAPMPASPVLDLGTGSGILAIAAEKLGAERVVACDLDPDAVAVARSNFRNNRVAPGVFVGSVNAVRSGSIGMVLANLTAPAISENLSDIVRVLVSGGCAVFSGILQTQSAALEAAVGEAGLTIRRRILDGEWACYRVHLGGH